MSQIAPSPGTVGSRWISCGLNNGSRRTLKVRDIMSPEMVTASLTDTVFSAAKKMSENNVSCVVVVDDEMVIGILTDEDMLKDLAGQDHEFGGLLIGERMSSPVVVVSPDTPVTAAGKTMEARDIKRLPVVDGGRLVGIVTQTDITRGLISVSPLKAVSDIMTTNVTTVDTAASVVEAAQIMSAKGISCLVATHRQDVAGIVTEKDLLRRVVAQRRDPVQTQVVDIMSFPIISVPPSYSVLSAAKKMDMMHLHRLVVMADSQIYGIITQTDITRAIRTEVEKAVQRQQTSHAVLNGLIQNTTDHLEQLQLFLNEASEWAQLAGEPRLPRPDATPEPDDNKPRTTIPAQR